MNKKAAALIILTLSVISFLTAGSVSAIHFEKEDNIHISKIHKIDDDLFAMGNIIMVDGEVKGDVFTVGSSTTINGKIEYSLNVAGEKLKQSGEIGGSVRFFGKEAIIEGPIGRSILAFSESFHLENRGIIEQDAVIYAQNIFLKGLVKENAELKGKTVIVTGTVNGDLFVKADHIKIQAPALIIGDFTYESDNQAEIDISSGVTINGQTTWNLPEKDEEECCSQYRVWIIALAKLAAAFLFGLILIAFCKKYMVESYNQVQTGFATSLAYGLVTIIVALVVAVFFVIALLMMLAGFVLISGGSSISGMISLAISIVLLPITSLLTVSGSILFYSGKIIVALTVGYYIVSKLKKGAVPIGRWQMLLGLIVMTLVFSIPFIGFLLYLFFSIVGAGAFVLGIKNCRRGSNSVNVNVKSDQ